MIRDPTFVLANRLEAVLWIGIGLGFLAAGLRRAGAVRRRCWLAAAAFIAFGGSDLVEAATGAWWRPWWLFTWKALCVAALFALLVIHWRRGGSS